MKHKSDVFMVDNMGKKASRGILNLLELVQCHPGNAGVYKLLQMSSLQVINTDGSNVCERYAVRHTLLM